MDKEPELTNLVQMESEFAIVDQKTVIQNVDQNQEKITCETCEKLVKVDVPCKQSNNVYTSRKKKMKAPTNLVWVIQRVKD